MSTEKGELATEEEIIDYWLRSSEGTRAVCEIITKNFAVKEAAKQAVREKTK